MKRIIKKAFIKSFIYLIALTDSNYSILFYNLIFILKKKELSFGFDKKNNLFFLKDSNKKQYFSNKIRGLNLYSSGLKFRANQIADSYKLKNISFKNVDKVIDCGANYGDLWLYLENKIEIDNYFTFEPGVNEFQALSKNVKNKNNYNLGLDNKVSSKDFYINEQDADSSIVEPKKYNSIYKIDTTTLNKFIIDLKIDKIKLLKLEAEGYEPEILLGTNKVINKIAYIAIDGGYERGKYLEETLSTQLNFLLKNNFEIIEINLKWGRALLKNKIFD
tara:strand:+ start:2367 stop:3194 length:828 start_codon:yes stop_codon:yes gene_type:complete